MLVIVVLSLFAERIELLSLGAIISFSSLIHRGSKNFMELKPLGGYANWITGFRLILIVIGSFLFSVVSNHVILGIMSLVVLLDRADGYLARKYGQTSFIGHNLDVEVDSFFVLLMCYYYFHFEGVGWWIIIPGVLRYLYIVMTSAVEKPNYRAKKRKYSTIIAGIFFIVLLVGLISPIKFKAPILFIGAVLIVASFARSFLDYLRFKNDKQTNG